MLDAIKKRTSIRSYENKPLTDEDKMIVKEILIDVEKKKGPFNHKAQFFYQDKINDDKKKIGTYGFVKHAPAFIGGVIENTSQAMIDYGFLFEEIILKLTEKDFGTVWLGGTFHRDDFDIDIKDQHIIPAVSPIGYPANRSIREKIIRGFAKANQRKPLHELFFEGEDLKAIDESHQYIDAFKAVQSAPSASNKQPWRIVFIKDTFHLFLKRTKGYGERLKIDIQCIDIGIALYHLMVSLEDLHLSPSLIKKKAIDLEHSDYIISVKI